MKTVSIVIPAYNEEQRIRPTLHSIEAFLSSRSRDAEIIVVDDGSRDATVEVVAASGCSNLRVIQVDQNRGKGNAVRLGMLAASGDHRIFMDADRSTPISELDRLEEELDTIGGVGVSFASIAVPGANVWTAQSGLRQAAGRIGSRLIQATVLPGVHDSQRGFKLFSGDAADAIFSRCVVDGWGFDVEALAIANLLGFEIVEVPTTWAHTEDSRVTPLSYVTTLAEVFGVRWRLLRGRYESADRSLDREHGDYRSTKPPTRTVSGAVGGREARPERQTETGRPVSHLADAPYDAPLGSPAHPDVPVALKAELAAVPPGIPQ